MYIARVNPKDPRGFNSPPWSLLDNQGNANWGDGVDRPVNLDDVVLVIPADEKCYSILAKVVHAATGSVGFLERQLLQPL